jgi:ubiquinone biosynthesis protein
MMGKLSPTAKKLLTSMLIGGVFKDSEFIMRNVLRMCESRGEVNQRKLESDISEIVDQFFFQDMEHIDIQYLLQSILRLFPENHLILPADMYLLARALLLMQTNGERMDPGFNISEHVRPYIRKLYKQRLKISGLLKDMYLSIEEMADLGRSLPFEIRDIMEKLKQGKIRFEFEHKGLGPAQQTLERTVNRLSFAVIVAAILIGSSLVLYSGIPPLWRDVPVLGIIGFLAAGALGLWLLISIIRHGRM